MINLMLIALLLIVVIVSLFAIFCYVVNRIADKDGLEKMLTKDNWRKE